MSIIRFKSADNRFFVEINNKFLNDIKNECINAENKETGGILIGYYSDDHYNAIIRYITGPPNDSRQGKSIFERGVNGLMDIILNKRKLGYHYLGEWHFHPNLSSQPSIVDDRQMKKFSKDKLLNCPEPILLIIGGNCDKGWELSLHVYPKNSKITLEEVNYS